MKHMSRTEAQGWIELDTARPVIVDAFDQREHGSDVDVVTVYYSFIDDAARATGGRSVVRYRVQVFVDGAPAFGGEVTRADRRIVHAIDCDLDDDCSCGAREEAESRG